MLEKILSLENTVWAVSQVWKNSVLVILEGKKWVTLYNVSLLRNFGWWEFLSSHSFKSLLFFVSFTSFWSNFLVSSLFTNTVFFFPQICPSLSFISLEFSSLGYRNFNLNKTIVRSPLSKGSMYSTILSSIKKYRWRV